MNDCLDLFAHEIISWVKRILFKINLNGKKVD
jgi:hypothetical protein